MRLVRLLPLLGATAVAAVMGLSASPAFAADGLTGSAYAVSASTTLVNAQTLGIPPIPVATYPIGGSPTVIGVDDAQHKLVHSTKVLSASSNVRDGVLTSIGSVTEVHVLDDLLRADLIEAKCTSDASGTKGTTVLLNAQLHHGARKVDVTPDTTTVDVDGVVKVLINEQIRNGSKLTVNAVHIVIGGKLENLVRGDVVLGQAVCSGPAAVQVPPTTTTLPPTTTPAPPTAKGGQPAPGGPATTHSAAPTTTTAAAGAGAPKRLANTGLSESLPYIAVGGLVLLGLGGGAVYLTRRRNRTTA